jgi:predicted nucleic acid-binding protein
MPYIVVYDANALFGNTQRDLLLRIGQQRHLVQAKWTQQILDEMTRAIRERYPNITEEKATRLQGLINDSVADCLVTGYEPLIPALELPDPDDRHVLAAAIKCGAQLIVTSDKDFRPNCWRPGASRPSIPTTLCSTRSASTPALSRHVCSRSSTPAIATRSRSTRSCRNW